WLRRLFLISAIFEAVALEHVPERLVVDLVVVLHFRGLDERSKLARRTISRGLLEIGKPALHIGAKNLADPARRFEVVDSLLNVIGQVALRLANVFNLRLGTIDAGLEDREERQVRVRIRRDGAHFNAHRLRVADGHAHHRSTIGRRSLDLVRRLKVRIEAAICIYAGIENQADIERTGENAIDEIPTESGKLLLALLIPHEIDLVLGDGDVGVHAAAVDADDGLGQEAGGVAHVVGNLTREQLVELDLVCSSDNFAVAVVDFKLAGRNLWVILLVLEAHRALHFSRRIDKLAQRIEREHMIVAASVDEIEAAGFVEAALGVAAGEQEAFNLV